MHDDKPIENLLVCDALCSLLSIDGGEGICVEGKTREGKNTDLHCDVLVMECRLYKWPRFENCDEIL